MTVNVQGLLERLEVEFTKKKYKPKMTVEKDRLIVNLAGYLLHAEMATILKADPEVVVLKFLEQYSFIQQFPKPGGFVRCK